MTVLHFVRHGQSTWNVKGLMQGQTHHPELTALGQDQALAAALHLRGTPVARILTSDAVRAAQTAQVIGFALGRRPWPTSLLREQDLGSLQGKTLAEAFADYDESHFLDPDRLIGGHGESNRDVHNRLAGLLASPLVAEADGPVVLVSHGDTIRWALAHLLGDDLTAVPWRDVLNGSVTTVTRDEGGCPKVQVWNPAAVSPAV